MERAQRRRIILCLLALCSLLLVFISFILLLSSTGDKVSSDRYDLAHESPNKPIKDQESSSSSVVVTPDVVYKPVSVKTKVFLASLGAILTLFIVGTLFLILKLVRKVEPLPPVDPDPEPEPEPIQPVIIEIYKSAGPWKWLFFACLVCFVGTLMYGYRRQQLARRQCSEDMIRKRLKYLVKTAKQLSFDDKSEYNSLQDLKYRGDIALTSAFYYAKAKKPQLLLFEDDGTYSLNYDYDGLVFDNDSDDDSDDYSNGGDYDARLRPVEHNPKQYVANLDDDTLQQLDDYLHGLQHRFDAMLLIDRLAGEIVSMAHSHDLVSKHRPNGRWTAKDALIALPYRQMKIGERHGDGLASLTRGQFPIIVRHSTPLFINLDDELELTDEIREQFATNYLIINVSFKDRIMYANQMSLLGAVAYLKELKAFIGTIAK